MPTCKVTFIITCTTHTIIEANDPDHVLVVFRDSDWTAADELPPDWEVVDIDGIRQIKD